MSAAPGPDVADDLPEEAYAVALASRKMTGPARLRTLLQRHEPSVAWERTRDDSESRRDVVRLWRRHVDLGISVLLPGRGGWPDRLLGDPRPPAVLFCLGDAAVLDGGPTVAVVGTRAPTRYGIGVAAQFGAELAAAGVRVVSGLALGIDGAAHEGACGAGAPPVGVVAGGLDDPYPARHARLWARVAASGAIVSESPAGVATEKWRFPVRNRLLASLCDMVVVVESRHHGGSRHTVEAALAFGLPVGAVPGSIRSATSEGPNALLADGALPVCSTGDILVALSLMGATVPSPDLPRTAAAQDNRPRPAHEHEVLAQLSPDPTSLEDLMATTGQSLAQVCVALESLARDGLARDLGGWWALS